MNLKGKLEIVCQTDVGQVRDHNEDFISYDEPQGIAVLADGMGGLNAGEVASSMTVHLLMDAFAAYRQGDTDLLENLNEVDAESPECMVLVEKAVSRANDAVFHVSQTQPQCRGMGTTVIAGLFHDNKFVVGHIGDSRVYRFRAGKLEQITKDHSYVQELIDKGLFTPQEARESNQKNVVTRALGIAPKVEVEVHEHKTSVGDIYLMCSDGLTDMVVDADIETTLNELGRNLSEAASHLINVANASGGKDNISVILARVLKPFPAEGGLMERIVNWFE
ncbi:MAG: Stp1/IreP family PP2C-type Ser/Thr phosphatase [Pseudomonadales bacterium]|nr:Stp1/IreP family PP2C-type Ser/Thr phosphatase [Pseudomonadales bacterium]